jgi:hypothetical protein
MANTATRLSNSTQLGSLPCWRRRNSPAACLCVYGPWSRESHRTPCTSVLIAPHSAETIQPSEVEPGGPKCPSNAIPPSVLLRLHLTANATSVPHLHESSAVLSSPHQPMGPTIPFLTTSHTKVETANLSCLSVDHPMPSPMQALSKRHGEASMYAGDQTSELGPPDRYAGKKQKANHLAQEPCSQHTTHQKENPSSPFHPFHPLH